MVSVNSVNVLNLQEGWQWWQAANRGQEGGSADRAYPIQAIPAKLVKRIAKGEFVDMAELLKDGAKEVGVKRGIQSILIIIALGGHYEYAVSPKLPV